MQYERCSVLNYSGTYDWGFKGLFWPIPWVRRSEVTMMKYVLLLVAIAFGSSYGVYVLGPSSYPPQLEEREGNME
jgi:hypothetical protein